jgi:hypothetical protein
LILAAPLRPSFFSLFQMFISPPDANREPSRSPTPCRST